MSDRVVSAAALPLVVVIVLGTVAAFVSRRDRRRRDPVRRFSHQPGRMERRRREYLPSSSSDGVGECQPLP
ncbi:hypothetical protein AB0280_17030 [Pseudarthrobacter sp902506025]|uniref:hypothetical protein n=1 Tax=Pseudarthrobacter sp. 902506025 TaxID=3155291 RepID=UPI00345011D9